MYLFLSNLIAAGLLGNDAQGVLGGDISLEVKNFMCGVYGF